MESIIEFDAIFTFGICFAIEDDTLIHNFMTRNNDRAKQSAQNEAIKQIRDTFNFTFPAYHHLFGKEVLQIFKYESDLSLELPESGESENPRILKGSIYFLSVKNPNVICILLTLGSPETGKMYLSTDEIIKVYKNVRSSVDGYRYSIIHEGQVLDTYDTLYKLLEKLKTEPSDNNSQGETEAWKIPSEEILCERNAHQQDIIDFHCLEIRKIRKSKTETASAIEAQDYPQQLYGLLSGDEGWRFVPIETAQKRTEPEWQVRDFCIIIPFGRALLSLNDKPDAYIDFQRANNVGHQTYFGMRSEIACLDHCALPLLLNALFRLSPIIRSYDEIRNMRLFEIDGFKDPVKGKKKKAKLKVLKRRQADIYRLLQILEIDNIRELDLLEEIIVENVGLQSYADALNRDIENLHAAIKQEEDKRTNLIMMALTVIMLFSTLIMLVPILIQVYSLLTEKPSQTNSESSSNTPCVAPIDERENDSGLRVDENGQPEIGLPIKAADPGTVEPAGGD